jgi:predicted RNA-binding Zn-ribbon protein involved in translation (DUF1610 family)
MPSNAELAELATVQSCRSCAFMPPGLYCLSHTCPDCGSLSTDVESHRCRL